ncbi:DUF6518 family protein [Pseudokineococcus basanitobsidens]|uniref:DUF6518 family protein n=1 Tax=Pseudokineococcus basanitobsidens TaxID=1926649 RepID=A0ABU8RNM7_9ACTN
MAPRREATAATSTQTQQSRTGAGAGTVRGVLAPLALSAGVGLGGGVLTSYAQLGLPEVLAPLANSASSWCLVAGLVALTARSAPVGALCGVVALLGMDAGYGLGSELRGYTYGWGTATFWALAALLAGPVVGAGVQWVRTDRRRLAPVAAGVLAGVVLGEGVYGLAVVGATTPTAYWVGQLVVGALGLAAVCALRLRERRRVAVAVLLAVVLVAAFVGVYRLPLIASFSF